MRIAAFVAAATLLIAPHLSGAGGSSLTPVAVRLHAEEIEVSFLDCGMIGTENEVIVTMSGGGFERSIPGALRMGDIVCSRMLTGNKTLDAWRRSVVQGDWNEARKNGTLALVAADGSELLRWTLTDAWPSKLLIDAPFEIIVITADAVVRGGLIQPQITWPQPSAITYGTPLGAAQLNATTAVPGTFTYDPAAGAILGAGVRSLTASFTPTDPASYSAATASVQLTVLKKELNVAADDKSKVYGAALPALSFSVSGFVNGENSSVLSGAPALTSSAGTASEVGAYPINIAAGTLTAANYSFNLLPGTLTVTHAPLSIVAANATRPYGSANPALTGVITGIVNNDPITGTYTTTATQQSNAGTYAIVPVLSDPSNRLRNYNVSTVNGTLTIDKVLLTVTADNQFVFFLDPIPALTFRYSGFVLGETSSVISGQPALSTSATPLSAPGTYPITVSAGTLAATNYNFRFVNGTLTIGGARVALERAASLTAPLLAGVTHPADRQKLQQTIDRLAAASAIADWTDDNRPRPADGRAIFDDAREAALRLENLAQTNQSGITATPLQPILDLIRKAARIVAFVSIADAEAAGASANSLRQARADLAGGDTAAIAGRIANAVIEYRNAWARFN